MSRLLKKKKQQAKYSEHEPPVTDNQTQSNERTYRPRKQHLSVAEEKKYYQLQAYLETTQASSPIFETLCTYAPATEELHNTVKIPFTIFLKPINTDLIPVDYNADKILRCGSCSAYMTYFNELRYKSYICFVCGRYNLFNNDLDTYSVSFSQVNYLVNGPPNIYPYAPPYLAKIFLIDVSPYAIRSKMVLYAAMTIKSVLYRTEFDDYLIYFYTYDETVHYYDFEGYEVQVTILDPSITYTPSRIAERTLSVIRPKLFELLDSLYYLYSKNQKHASSFLPAFDFVLNAVKHTGSRIYITQANYKIIYYSFTNYNIPVDIAQRPKSQIYPKNRYFFNKYANVMHHHTISFALFVFTHGFKNLKVFARTLKLSSSDMFLYQKDSPEYCNKFYYEFYQLLGAPTYSNVLLDLFWPTGVLPTSYLGSGLRVNKPTLCFNFVHYSTYKQLALIFKPIYGKHTLPYICFQTVSNYFFDRKHYMQVNMFIMPMTYSIDRIMTSINYQTLFTVLFRIWISSTITNNSMVAINQFKKSMAIYYTFFLEYYKKYFPPYVTAFFLTSLGFLKNHHSQLDRIINTPLQDQIVAQRSYLVNCCASYCNTYFNPYLFNLSTMTDSMCQLDNFEYPYTCTLTFYSIRNGFFLLDSGSVLYLYIAKSYDETQYKDLFGKKPLKPQDLYEELLTQQPSLLAKQVINLVSFLRYYHHLLCRSKSLKWIPLFIVRCGEKTLRYSLFYLNFIEYRYAEFKSFNMSFTYFMEGITKL